MNVTVYCDPTTSMMRKPTRASSQSANGVMTGAHFTKQESAMNVEVCCDPTLSMMRNPTQRPTDVIEDEEGYSSCALVDTFQRGRKEKMHLGFSNKLFDTQVELPAPEAKATLKKQNVSSSTRLVVYTLHVKFTFTGIHNVTVCKCKLR